MSYITNPETGRRIQYGGRTHRELIRQYGGSSDVGAFTKPNVDRCWVRAPEYNNLYKYSQMPLAARNGEHDTMMKMDMSKNIYAGNNEVDRKQITKSPPPIISYPCWVRAPEYNNLYKYSQMPLAARNGTR